jgi:8-oxo-dGTP diphosphatase
LETQNPETVSVQKRAAVAVIQQQGKFLTIKRSQTVLSPGKVCFPGGKLETGESVAQALVREMQEELSILVNPIGHVWQSQSGRGSELNWWTAEIVEGEVIKPNPDEVNSFAWMTSTQMVGLPNLLDSNLAFFQALARGEFELRI